VPTPAEDLLAPGEKERLELVDRLQRLAAEFSNYQKRTDRRIEEERREAVRRVVLDLLPAIDNFDRAMAAAEATRDFQALFEGIRLVHGQLLAGLAAHGITPIETGRRAFDPQHHEAVAHLPSHEHPAGQVIEETQRGYRFGDQVLRASRVAVSSGKPAEGGDAPEPNGGTEGGAQGEGA
jgi:molecular chaperone GrpE